MYVGVKWEVLRRNVEDFVKLRESVWDVMKNNGEFFSEVRCQGLPCILGEVKGNLLTPPTYARK